MEKIIFFCFNFYIRPRTSLSRHGSQNESPAVLRKTHNFTWTPREGTVEAVSVIESI